MNGVRGAVLAYQNRRQPEAPPPPHVHGQKPSNNRRYHWTHHRPRDPNRQSRASSRWRHQVRDEAATQSDRHGASYALAEAEDSKHGNIDADGAEDHGNQECDVRDMRDRATTIRLS